MATTVIVRITEPLDRKGSSQSAATGTRGQPAIHQVRELVEVGGRPGGIDAGDTTVWVSDTEGGSVHRIGISSRKLEGEPIRVGPDPGAVAVGGDAVWVANNGDGTVTRIEP